MDSEGRVLVRRNDGLARWENGHWRTFGADNGLPPGSSDAILVDRDGDIWMTVDGEGLVRWAGYEWIENWDASQGMPAAPTWSIARDTQGALLVGNEHGIGRQAEPDKRFVPALQSAGIQVGHAAQRRRQLVDAQFGRFPAPHLAGWAQRADRQVAAHCAPPADRPPEPAMDAQRRRLVRDRTPARRRQHAGRGRRACHRLHRHPANRRRHAVGFQLQRLVSAARWAVVQGQGQGQRRRAGAMDRQVPYQRQR